MIVVRRYAWPAVLIALLCGPGLASAREKLCLVLGGGGARGAAHVGVLQVLERERIPVDCITGTSMGAIVGSLYAAGYTADEIERLIHAIDWKAVFHDEPQRSGLPVRRKDEDLNYLLGVELGIGRDGKLRLPAGAIQGQQIDLLLRRLLLPAWNIDDFAQLPIPFRTVAADIATGEPVVFDHGDLATAVRASMSVPGAFAPVKVGDRLLVDGGIADNVPIDLARQLGAERIIAINVGTGLRPVDELNSPLAVAMQTLAALMLRQTERQLRELGPDDVLIRPELGDIHAASFDRAAAAIPLGAAATVAALPQLRKFALNEADYAAWRAQHRPRHFDPPLIAFLHVLESDSLTATYVERKVDNQIGQRFNVAELEQQINQSYGNGNYQRIGYRLVEEDGRTGLVVDPQDKSWGPWFLQAGLAISDDFNGRSAYQLNAEARLTGINDRGAYWRSQLQAGQIAGLRSEFVQPFGADTEFFLDPYIDYHAYEQSVGQTRPPSAELRIAKATAGAGLGWSPSSPWQFELYAETGHDHAQLHIGDPQAFQNTRDSNGWGAVAVEATRDTLDSAQFPRSGSRGQMRITRLVPALGADRGGDIGALVWDTALSSGPNTVLLGVRAQTVWNDPVALRSVSFLGGFANLSGFAEREVYGEHSALARAVYYRRLSPLDQFVSVPTYVGGSLEYGNVFASEKDFRIGNMLTAGSLFLGFETPFGPLFLGYGRNSQGNDSIYLNFGSLLRPLEH
ncbi:MAG: patatin-like phospholipase family protein [Dokdonella sp.]